MYCDDPETGRRDIAMDPAVVSMYTREEILQRWQVQEEVRTMHNAGLLSLIEVGPDGSS
jgi:hypothetical protein